MHPAFRGILTALLNPPRALFSRTLNRQSSSTIAISGVSWLQHTPSLMLVLRLEGPFGR